SWHDVGFFPGGEDALPQGLEHLVVTPDGLAAYDTVLRELVLFDAAGVRLSFPVRFTGDVVVTPDGFLATIDTPAREVALWSQDGVELSRVRLPELSPTHVTLVVDGAELAGADVFGNLHAIARLDGAELAPSLAPSLQELASEVTWDREGRTMVTAGFSVELPDAVKASGQRFGDWLVVDVVTSSTGPIQVERSAYHVPTGQQAELPLERLYAPRGEFALDGGDLLVLVPLDAGPQVWRVSP
ncbi:MAG: hypothetical protein GY884_08000, partial [Proteobacteria bacterium]|nr:hypothetical protein [Pseudomonadota bacterium]